MIRLTVAASGKANRIEAGGKISIHLNVFFFKVIFGLTSTGQEDFDGHILQQIASGEDGSYLRKVPLSVQVIAILQRLPTTTEKSVTLRGSSSEARRTQKHGYNVGHKSRRKFLRLLKRRLCGA